MKVVYGNPKTIMTMGMAMLGETPTPFFGFVDKAKVDGDNFFTSGPNSTALIDKIDKVGGAIVFIENPDAAERMSGFILHLFAGAIEGAWGDINQVEAELQ